MVKYSSPSLKREAETKNNAILMNNYANQPPAAPICGYITSARFDGAPRPVATLERRTSGDLFRCIKVPASGSHTILLNPSDLSCHRDCLDQAAHDTLDPRGKN